MKEVKLNGRTIRLLKADITDMEVEAFVYYATPDLKLGMGYGGAISVRGGPTVQKELEAFGKVAVESAIVTGAGQMKAGSIIHAVGPRFQEEDLEGKLSRTIQAALKAAEEKGFKQVAFPPMGAGFYGVPLPVCSRIMLDVFSRHLKGSSGIQELIIAALDSREYKPFEAAMAGMA